MTYQLFIDDERMPVARDGRPWMFARNMREVKNIVGYLGAPDYISFDHDLGDSEPTGYDIAKWLVEQDMDGNISLDNEFDFYVHSQNPIGKANIENYLESYLKMKRGG